MDKKLLTKKEALAYIGVKRYQILDNLVRKGELKYKLVGKRIKFPVWSLEQWLQETKTHIDYTKGATFGTRISRMLPNRGKEYSLDSLLEQQTATRLNGMSSKKLLKQTRKVKYYQAA